MPLSFFFPPSRWMIRLSLVFFLSLWLDGINATMFLILSFSFSLSLLFYRLITQCGALASKRDRAVRQYCTGDLRLVARAPHQHLGLQLVSFTDDYHWIVPIFSTNPTRISLLLYSFGPCTRRWIRRASRGFSLFYISSSYMFILSILGIFL